MAEQSENQIVGTEEAIPSHTEPPPLVKRDTFGHSMQHPNDILAQLISMGFSPSMAETAIFESGGGNLDRALAWLLDSHKPVSDEELDAKDVPSDGEDASDLYVETDDDIRIQKKVPPPPTTRPQKSILRTTSAYHSLANSSSKSRIRDWIFGGSKASTYANTKVNTSNFMRNSLFKSKSSNHPPESTIPFEDDDITEEVEKEIKRVRFCTDLHMEVPPSPIDWSNHQDMANTEHGETDDTEEEQKPRSEEMYTPGQVLEHYEATCRTREEPVIGQLVSTMKRAESRKQSLSNIELRGVPFTRESMLTFTDSLDLPFGLTTLTLENCGVDDDLLKTLIHSLIFTCQISSLSLARNKKIKCGGLRYIGLFIKKSQHLKHLDLSGIPLDKKSARQIGPYFAARQKDGLESLKLDACGLRSNILEFIVPSLRRSSIRSLSLRNNQINHVGALWVGVLLRDYEDDVAPEIVYSRARPCPPPVFGWKVGLEKLDVSMNEIKGGVQYVAQSLKRNLMLKELLITQNGIDTRGMAQLADSLAVNKNLKAFDLSRNPCSTSTDGIIAMRSALASNQSLETLILSETKMNSEGAIAIAEFLPETKCLRNLDLSSNPEIDIAGVLALSVSLRMNWSIVCLDVSVAPDDPELAELSRDILSTCIRNMEKVPHKASRESISSSDTKPQTHNVSGSSVEISDAKVVTTSPSLPLRSLKSEDATHSKNQTQSEIQQKALQMENEEGQVLTRPNDSEKGIKFGEASIVTISQEEQPDSLKNQSVNKVNVLSTPQNNDGKLREKDRAMINKEATTLVDKYSEEQQKVKFGDGSIIEISDDTPIISSPKHEQKIQLNTSSDNTNSEMKLKNKCMETQEAQALLNPLPRNEDKKVQFGNTSLIETDEQDAPGWSADQKRDVDANGEAQDPRIKEKSKCMEREEAQVLRNPPIKNENKKVQFGHTKLIQVIAEEPVMLSPKEEKTIELYPTSDTQKSQVKEKGKKMETEEAQALRKPTKEENIHAEADLTHSALLNSQPTSTNGLL
ncbi:hypothetical protein K7432_006372 [Basidiobolus ranarum]|uniref:UBA domain-containing protein n=1 Tax=Basidiobolus ranarum TaxID=34480 RepID=A0ABR2WV05_9FUNG